MEADRARFEAIFRQHYGAVVRYAVRRVGRDLSEIRTLLEEGLAEFFNRPFQVACQYKE